MAKRGDGTQISGNASSALKHSRYRPEIDGLRAFAVVAVIINHFNKDILPGGYLGVDIFFVISGYVITSSLFGRPSKDFKDFISGFYERRVKRLVPALSVFVLITSLAICLFDPTPKFSLRTGLTSLFGLSNLYLLKQSTDYFAQSTALNVFTHTWSLAVEEQFYIFFPFLIWFTGFGRQTKNGARNLFLVVGTLTFASLFIFLFLYSTNQQAAYFLMPSRFWEMATGCLIFLGFLKRASIEQLLERVPPVFPLGLIVVVMYLPMSLAAESTIAVVTLSSVLIASLKTQTIAFRFFTKPSVIYIGLISYSLYLWHWAVLSISRWTIGIHWWSIPFQVALMLGLAVASYRWVETPLRKGQWFGNRWKTLMFGGGVLVSLSAALALLGYFHQGRLYLGEASEQEDEPFASNNINRANCMDHPNFASAIDKCWINNQNHDLLQSKSPFRIFFIGDSHTESLSQAAEFLSENIANPIFIHSRRGTVFPIVSDYWIYHGDANMGFLGRQNNDSIQAAAEDYLLAQITNGDIVVITLRLPAYFGNDGCSNNEKDFIYNDASGDRISRKEFFDDWKKAVSVFALKLELKNAYVILQTPTPEWRTFFDVNDCKKSMWFNFKTQCIIDKISLENEYKPILESLNELDNSHDNLFIFDGLSLLCPDDICRYLSNGKELYRDEDHLSNYSARNIIGPKLLDLIVSIGQSKSKLLINESIH